MPTRLIDSHCHLDDPRFDADRETVLERAREIGIAQVVVPGVTAATWPRTRRVCAEHPGLNAAYGLHPYFLAEHQDAHLAELEVWIEQEHPIAVGECGLDLYLKDLDLAAQEHFFAAQLATAQAAGLPVIIHARRAVDQVLKHLRRVPGLRADIHSFAGSEQQARQLIDLGCYLGIGGSVTYERAQRLRRVVQVVPLESLLLETDAPDQPGASHRGDRNEPAYLTEVLATVAALRGEDTAHVARVTAENAAALFGLRPAEL
jgi:TatD DNase family protein